MHTKHRFNIVSNGSETSSRPTSRARSYAVVLGLILAASLWVLGVTPWTRSEQLGEQRIASSEVKEHASSGAEFDYFPARYTNQAQSESPEEHIPTF